MKTRWMRHVMGITLVLAGCEGRPLPAADGGTSEDGPTTTTNDLALPAKSDTDCLIAIRVDTCCTAPQAATVGEVRKDPCLLPWPASNIPKACFAKWPEKCDMLDCAQLTPPSRLVVPIPGFGCIFKDECLKDSDCVLAVDHRQCCACAYPYPRELVEKDLCVVAVDEGLPGACPDRCHADVQCEACPPSKGRPMCSRPISIPENPPPKAKSRCIFSPLN